MSAALSDPILGMRLFKSMFVEFANNIFFHDRSNTITTPFKAVNMPGMEIPAFASQSLGFDEICHNRARSLMDYARNTNRRILVMYSGGIDSTLILTSFLKAFDEKIIRDNLLVLMNNTSIDENPKFYHDHVIRKCSIGHSQFFNRYIGNDGYLMITGEGNDQLFGSQVLSKNKRFFSNKPWDLAVDRSRITAWLQQQSSLADAERIFDILDQICQASPVPIDTIYKWFWWINFTCKWQNVFLRSISFADSVQRTNFKPFENYDMFFRTPEFQLWSMNNSNNLSGNTWNRAKQICKDIIYDYNHDADYRNNKQKQGSLHQVLYKKHSVACIDSGLTWYDDFDHARWLVLNNSFTG
jgi:hypothetical protein